LNLQIVILKIKKDMPGNIIEAGNSKKTILHKIIFIIKKNFYIILFYQNSPFHQVFYLRWQINVSILKVEYEIKFPLKLRNLNPFLNL